MIKHACLVLALAFLVGVGSNAAATPPQDQSETMTPGQVVMAFYKAAAENRVADARKHMSTAMIASLPASGGLKKVCDDWIGTGPTRGVQILSQKVNGSTAVVAFRLHLEDGSKRDSEQTLTKEGGEWKLDPKKAESHGRPKNPV